MNIFAKIPNFNKYRKKLLFGVCAIFLLAILALASVLCAPLTEDGRFQTYTEQIFRSELGCSTISLHYTLANPSDYGIKQRSITLGDLSRTAHAESTALTENYLASLHEFSREELTPENQLTYDVLEDYLNTCQEGAPYYLYNEPLSPTLGVQAQLPILLAEYTFRTKQDIEDYLTLLTRVPDYFESIIQFEKEKSRAGLFMSDSCLKDILQQCSDFINNGEENYLKQIFDDQIDSFTNLTADEKISYKKQNETALEAYVIPAYQELMNQMAKLLGTGKNTGGLCNLPQGKEYYKYLVHSTTGDASSVEKIESRIKEEIVSVYGEIQDLLKNNTDLTSLSLDGVESQDPAEILETLQEVITEDFPAAPQISCEVKYVHDSLEDHLSPAFYMIPPIDDITNNVIYINRASNYNALELYTTLAHEGYPGHLYQTVTFESQNDSLLRSILDFGGYTEGWATYVEMYAYSTWSENPTLASLYQKDRSLMLGIASLLDIGIHYRGYTRSAVAGFLGKFGITEETSDAMYNTILESPANYLKYYVGYLNFLDLRDWLKEKLGDRFTLKEYHARVLKIGPCSFPILKEYLNDQNYLSSIAG